MGRKNKRDNRFYIPLDMSSWIIPSKEDKWEDYDTDPYDPPLSTEQFGGSGYSDVAYGSDTSTGSY